MVFRVKKDNEIKVYDLIPIVIKEEDDWRQWAFQNGSFSFKVREEPFGKINRIYDLPTGISENDLEDAPLLIYEAFDTYKREHRQNLKLATEPIVDAFAPVPKNISISKYFWSLDTVLQMINRKQISLFSDFQRKNVWDNTQKSRFIESLLLEIPIPAFYFAKDEKGGYHVVDGLQRLTALKEFLNNEFSLINLVYFRENNNSLEGYYYKTGVNHKGIDILSNGAFEFRLFSASFDCVAG